MDKKRLQELGGVVAEATEQEKALQKAPKVLEEGKSLEEGGFGFGPAGHGGDKTPEQNVISRLAHTLRDAKVFLRDGNIEDAALMIDRAYAEVTKVGQG